MYKLFLSLICLLLFFPVSAQNRVIAYNGVLDLRTWKWEKNGIASLTGNWEFYWKKFYSPSFFNDSSVAYTKHFAFVPSLWNKYIPGGQNSDRGFGYATYHLVVLCPASKELLALEFFTIESSYRLFVNDKEILNVGHADTTAETTIAELKPSIVNVLPKNNKLDIVIQVSNFSNSVGGIWYFNKLGTARQIHSGFIKNISVALFVAGCFFVAGIYYLILFLHFRSGYVFLFFGLLCFIFCTRSLVLEEMPVIYISNLKWEFARRAEYISLYLSVPIAALFSYHLFPRDFSIRVLYIILAVCAIPVALSLFAPYYFYTFLLKYYEAIILITVFYGLYVYIRAALKKRPGSYLFLAGFCIFLITIVNDLLYENLIINTMWMFYIGLASFCIILSILLSRQFVQVFHDLQVANKKLSVANKELDIVNNQMKEKNEELKEINYKLDKFVHRTSHDLKAPLISVLKIIDAAEDERDVGKLHTYFLMQKKTLNRISNLVKDIINFSKNKRLELDLGEIDFTDLINRAFEDHAITLHAENIKKEVNIKQYEKFISDSRRVSVIINNLISNAIKYADATKSNQKITIEVSVANNMATIEASENGIGMEEKNLNEIFSLFYTTTNSIAGPDVGLYVVKETVEGLNGYITVNSKKGQGTNIKVMIPDMGHKM